MRTAMSRNHTWRSPRQRCASSIVSCHCVAVTVSPERKLSNDNQTSTRCRNKIVVVEQEAICRAQTSAGDHAQKRMKRREAGLAWIAADPGSLLVPVFWAAPSNPNP